MPEQTRQSSFNPSRYAIRAAHRKIMNQEKNRFKWDISYKDENLIIYIVDTRGNFPVDWVKVDYDGGFWYPFKEKFKLEFKRILKNMKAREEQCEQVSERRKEVEKIVVELNAEGLRHEKLQCLPIR